MRQHKYRAWDKEAGRLCEVDEIDFLDESVHVSWYVDATHQGHYHLRRGEYILEQFTGLKDKNGNEIYEGDILLQKGLNGETTNIVPVVWSKRNICFEAVFRIAKLNLPLAEYVEVIGNIHDDPESQTKGAL